MCNNDNDNMLVKLQMTPKPRPNHEDQDICPVNNKTIIKKRLTMLEIGGGHRGSI
jgi:hypothetical protein